MFVCARVCPCVSVCVSVCVLVPHCVCASDSGALSEVVLDHLGQQLNLYVYNTDTDCVRLVALKPRRGWGGDGCLGAHVLGLVGRACVRVSWVRMCSGSLGAHMFGLVGCAYVVVKRRHHVR